VTHCSECARVTRTYLQAIHDVSRRESFGADDSEHTTALEREKDARLTWRTHMQSCESFKQVSCSS
jgi:hypothetical protein